MFSYKNILSMDHDPKIVPYGGSGVLRNDGDANYGFKDLKGKPELLTAIPELIRDPALLKLVTNISLPTTGLFSIGCVSGAVIDDIGFRYSGYVEFAFNSIRLIDDAIHYFPLYFHFDRALSTCSLFGNVQYQWELKPAMFVDAEVNGYTCSVFINTDYVPTKQEAITNWEQALSLLAVYLASVPVQSNELLYGE